VKPKLITCLDLSQVGSNHEVCPSADYGNSILGIYLLTRRHDAGLTEGQVYTYKNMKLGLIDM
jgi:hypothetical protein